MSGPATLAVIVAVVLTGGAVVAVVRFEAQRVNRRLDRIMAATGIAEPTCGSRSRALAHETAHSKGESRSMRNNEALTPAERGTGRDHEVEQALAGLAGIRAVREPDS